MRYENTLSTTKESAHRERPFTLSLEAQSTCLVSELSLSMQKKCNENYLTCVAAINSGGDDPVPCRPAQLRSPQLWAGKLAELRQIFLLQLRGRPELKL